MIYDYIQNAVQNVQLAIFGILEHKAGSLMLLGPDEPYFWPAFMASPEWNDGQCDPMDRWSVRVITTLAQDLDAIPRFPFPPDNAPFLAWALASGRMWLSPVKLLIHDEAGLMVSFRGALQFAHRITAP